MLSLTLAGITATPAGPTAPGSKPPSLSLPPKSKISPQQQQELGQLGVQACQSPLDDGGGVESRGSRDVGRTAADRKAQAATHSKCPMFLRVAVFLTDLCAMIGSMWLCARNGFWKFRLLGSFLSLMLPWLSSCTSGFRACLSVAFLSASVCVGRGVGASGLLQKSWLQHSAICSCQKPSGRVWLSVLSP